MNFNEILKKGGNWYKRTTSTIMLNGHYILRNLVSYIRLNIVVQISFFIHCICFGEPLGAAVFELMIMHCLLARACARMIKLRVQD